MIFMSFMIFLAITLIKLLNYGRHTFSKSRKMQQNWQYQLKRDVTFGKHFAAIFFESNKKKCNYIFSFSHINSNKNRGSHNYLLAKIFYDIEIIYLSFTLCFIIKVWYQNWACTIAGKFDSNQILESAMSILFSISCLAATWYRHVKNCILSIYKFSLFLSLFEVTSKKLPTLSTLF